MHKIYITIDLYRVLGDDINIKDMDDQKEDQPL